MEENSKDLLGIKPIGNAIEKAADGIGSFLGKICMPVAEEIGLYFQDGVKAWRARNAADIASQADKILKHQGGTEDKSAHPLLAWKIIENGSFADSQELKSYWAGLLASSCTQSPDDSNHIFVDLVSQLTVLQARVIDYACNHSKVYLTDHALLVAEHLDISIEEVLEIANTDDIQRMDRELDRLSSLGLIGGTSGQGGIDVDSGNARITPTPLCLHLHARCAGHSKDPTIFYRAQKRSNNAN